MKPRAGPFDTACSRPISPHALRIVCLYQSTGSSSPLPVYSGTPASSAIRCDSYVAETGNTRSRARAGRGTKASSSGSVMEYTSWIWRAWLRPSLCRREVMSSGFASRGTKAREPGDGSGLVVVDMVPGLLACGSVGLVGWLVG